MNLPRFNQRLRIAVVAMAGMLIFVILFCLRQREPTSEEIKVRNLLDRYQVTFAKSDLPCSWFYPHTRNYEPRYDLYFSTNGGFDVAELLRPGLISYHDNGSADVLEAMGAASYPILIEILEEHDTHLKQNYRRLISKLSNSVRSCAPAFSPFSSDLIPILFPFCEPH